MATSTNARKRNANPAAATAASTTEEAPARRKRKPSKFKSFLRTILLVLIVVAASVGATIYYTWPASAGLFSDYFTIPTIDSGDESVAAEIEQPKAVVKEAPPPPPSERPIFSKLEPFTVTISEGGARSRILHVAITLQVQDEASTILLQEYNPVVRDRVLKILSEQNPSYVQTPEGREQLVDSLSNSLRSSYDNGSSGPRIANVLFTAFVIQ